ncbi:hypothetical protein OF829_17390 [Sphingomonas sp. LB-2]|uniref:hypothetical protein n=1 Tax=Sphingomonas caeni TaxID=2984949 RepID=UPI002232B999|nr:hypothetical protein [Sphingomonas caeni]MCW3849016.1 hypothetical protein [Sphingomonas caeni]
MSRGPDAATQLERALLAGAEAAGCPLAVTEAELTRWASVTFTGARHMLTLAGTASPALTRWIDALPEAEFALRGHLVADLSVEAVRREGAAVRVMLEVLTVEER